MNEYLEIRKLTAMADLLEAIADDYNDINAHRFASQVAVAAEHLRAVVRAIDEQRKQSC